MELTYIFFSIIVMTAKNLEEKESTRDVEIPEKFEEKNK